MKGLTVLFLCLFIALGSFGQDSSFYELSAETIDGEEFSFEQLKGKKVMIVNTATRCSLSPQFKGLQELYEAHAEEGFVILAFPQNDFANREPSHNGIIKEACERRFGITFPLMGKITVIGKQTHPVYLWLTSKEKNGVMDSEIKWNFQKYLIDETGKISDVIEPIKRPNCEEVVAWLGN